MKSRLRRQILTEYHVADDSESPPSYYDARRAVYSQSIASRKILEQVVLPELRNHNIKLYYGDAIFQEKHYKEIMHIFMSKVLSYLQPVIIHVNAGRRLNDLKIVLNIPANSLPRFFTLSKVDDKHYIVYLDDIIRLGIQSLFKNFEFKGIYTIKINRNADLHVDDDTDDEADFVEVLQRGLDLRKTGAPSRFQYGYLPHKTRRTGPGKNIELIRVVGRYLEHSRVFIFHNKERGRRYEVRGRKYEVRELLTSYFLLHAIYFTTVTSKNVAGIEVVLALPLRFWLLNNSSSSRCNSSALPFFSAASNAFMVGP